MQRFLRNYWFELVACLVGAIAFVISAELEAFEEFYEFSRSHESWELDELILIYAIGAIILPVFLLRAKSRLKAALKAVTAAEERAQHIARHDALTGLFNRRCLHELLDKAIAHARTDKWPAILLMDLDRFKAVNDLRGHQTGDLILQAVAQKLRTCCPEDCSVARLGGDEFAILMPEINSPAEAARIARQILTEFENPIKIGNWLSTVGISIGIGSWHTGDDAQTLLRNADQAMYRAKKDGRGRFAFFDQDLGDELHKQALMETELRKAVDNREIQPYFQPIVDIETSKICGFEVLSRWTSKSLGPIRPDVFIQLAEDTGLIGAITWQVMHKSLLLASEWGDDIFIAFNLSPRLFNEELLENIKWHLAETSFPPHRVEIEITENAVIDNMDDARKALDALKDLGICISLDDFGTGFSSLATLSKLPFDKIKIDKSFVTEVENEPQNAKIVSAILALATSLDIKVTAEGIETDDDLAFLAQRACRQGQGYLFARPLDAKSAKAYLSQAMGAADHRNTA